MRITIITVLITLVAIAASDPSTDSSADHVKEIENLRDLINPETNKKGKKPRKYKCIVIEEGDDDEIIADKLTQKDETQSNKNKFVFIEADDERRDMVITATEATPISVAEMPVSTNPLRFQQPQQQQQQQVQYQQAQPQQQPHQQFQQQQSPFLQSPNEFEKISEEEAAVEYPKIQQQLQSRTQYQQRVVTLPPPPQQQQPPQSFQQQQPSHSRPPLKQIHLPKAHSFSAAAARNNFPAAQIQTTLPPEIVNAPRDSQNRPLILAPEHCEQIKKYANMYGVSDVKAWVHNNCSFAQTYLPTASCEEIDILVGSCYRNQQQ